MRRLIRMKRGKRTLGQTALEYALVIGVITVGVIVVAQKVFVGTGEKPSAAENLMNSAVEQAQKTVTGQ